MQITIVDKIGFAVAAAGVVLYVAFMFFVVPEFQKMFADFGGSLPVPTQWLFDRPSWLGLTVGFAPAVVVGAGYALRVRNRAWFTGAACALFVLEPLVFIVGLYLPILTIAGSIR